MIEGTLSSYGGSSQEAKDSRRTQGFLNRRGRFRVRREPGKVVIISAQDYDDKAMTNQERIEELSDRVFGKAAFSLRGHDYVDIAIWGQEPYLVRHDGLGNILASAQWNGQKWVVTNAQNKEGERNA